MEPETNGNPEQGEAGHSKKRKRLHENDNDESRDARNYIPPAHRHFRTDSVTSRVTDWLEKIPTPQDCQLPVIGPLQDEDTDKYLERPEAPYSETMSRLRTTTATTSSTPQLVKKTDYRTINLKENNIKYVYPGEAPFLPEPVAVDCDTAKGCNIKVEAWWRYRLHRAVIRRCHEGGRNESELQRWFATRVSDMFDETCGLELESVENGPFLAEYFPWSNAVAPVSLPKPDIIYGYTLRGMGSHFSDKQIISGQIMNPEMGRVSSGPLCFPFLIVELKMDGRNGGSRWVGENQCLGSTATCVTMVDRLNEQLLKRDSKAERITNTVFSVLMDQYFATLYVSWMDGEEGCCMRRISHFEVDTEAGVANMFRCVNNILEWGRGTRLQNIHRALDAIAEADELET